MRFQVGGIDGGIIGGAMPGAIGAGGFHTIPRIPPTRPKIRPMKRPPVLMMLNKEKSRTITPQATCCWGFMYSITAPTMTISAKMTPTAPYMRAMFGSAPTPIINPPIADITAMMTIATNKIMSPPIRDKTNAAVGFSLMTTSPKILRVVSKYHYKSIAETGREETCSQTTHFIRGHPFHPRSFPHAARLLRKVPCQAGDQGRGRGEAEERQARDEGQVSRCRH